MRWYQTSYLWYIFYINTLKRINKRLIQFQLTDYIFHGC